ncbi:hypothetical protein [Sphingomonas sp.]|uniref:hypothetical protein n=1 Tax=Sphingomonas sp. TaxID=28214 RepID=UPI003CC666FC
MATTPIQITCGSCGSTDVARDAWANWSTAEQRWELLTVFDCARCHACDGATTLVESILPITRKAEAGHD